MQLISCILLHSFQIKYNFEIIQNQGFMEFKALLLSVFFLSLLISVNGQDYTNFSSWGGKCQTGKRQSPINIVTQDLRLCEEEKMKIRLWPGAVLLNAQGQNLKNLFPASSLRVVDRKGKIILYESAQYHWHSPSEHQIDSVSFDLELHIVHTINPYFTDINTLSVVGLLFKQNNTITEDIFDHVDFTLSGELTPKSEANFKVELQNILSSGNFFNYEGSLTTPSCDEIVNWFVFQKILFIKPANLIKMKAAINHSQKNSRPVQPLNDRKISYIIDGCESIVKKLSISYNSEKYILFCQVIILLILTFL